VPLLIVDHDNLQSQHAIEVLQEHVEGQQNEINVMADRLSRQQSLPSQTRSVTEIQDIEVFRKKFELPGTEFCIVCTLAPLVKAAGPHPTGIDLTCARACCV
jgi:hypothetical protein